MPFLLLIILAGVICGATSGLLGVYIVGLRLPFIGICISHAAMAASVFSILLGLNPTWPTLIFSALVAMSLALIRPEKSRLDPNVALAILFSLMLGLTFLGIGLIQNSRAQAMSLLWGSILFANKQIIITISIAGLCFVVFALLFNKELKAILFSRVIASATGVHESFVYCLFLGLCGIILAVNLPLVGGLMIFCLITNPAAAAYQISKGHKSVVFWAITFGISSAVIGLLIANQLNLPAGACIVLTSTAIFAAAAVFRIKLGSFQ